MKTKHIEGKVQSLDIFNKRLDNLIAMRGVAGCDSLCIDDSGFKVSMHINGAVVLVNVEMTEEGYLEHELPMKFNPPEKVTLYCDGDSSVWVDPARPDNPPMICGTFVRGGATTISQFSASYPTSTVGIEELEDLRIGYDGTTYETAGTAIRSQFAKMAEDFGSGVVYAQYHSGMETVMMPYAEIWEAYEKGKLVVLVGDDGYYYMPILIIEAGAIFERIVVNELCVERYLVAVDNEDNCTTLHSEYSATGSIDDAEESTEKTWSSKKVATKIEDSAKGVTIEYKHAIKEAIKEAEDAGYKKAIETFCPEFNSEGRLVQCYPLIAYPYDVSPSAVGDAVAGAVLVFGKNLYDQKKYPLDKVGYAYSGTSNQGMLSNSENYRRSAFIPCSHLVGQTIVLSHPPKATNPGMSFYSYLPDESNSGDCKAAWCGGTTGASIKVPDDAMYMVFSVNKENADADIQIELGSESTEYEDYIGKRFEVGEDVVLHEGLNIICAEEEDCVASVICREDIATLVRNLQK